MEMDVMKEEIRIDKYLADMSVGTRSQVKQMIRKGIVTVNGETVKKPEQKVRIQHDRVAVSGRDIAFENEVYLMLYKPAGVVSATKDPREKTVLDLIQDKKRKDLFPAGRLDKDTEGLLLLTNDGKLAHEMLSPKKHVDKVYFALIQGKVTTQDQEAFRQGVDIGEDKLTLPADLNILKSDDVSEIEITIREGKFHQIKRMFEAVNKKVIYLRRISFGPLELDPALHPGEYRKLTEEEIRIIKGETNE